MADATAPAEKPPVEKGKITLISFILIVVVRFMFLHFVIDDASAAMKNLSLDSDIPVSICLCL